MIRLEDPTTLSLLFHLNSEPWLNDEAYKAGNSNQEFKQPAEILAETILPTVQSPLTELFGKRRSCRAFSCEIMTLAQVAAVLSAAYGLVEVAEFGDQGKFFRRTVPSAGGLFPLEVYVFLQRVQAWKRASITTTCWAIHCNSLHRETSSPHSNLCSIPTRSFEMRI